jgi:DNA-binding PadR family transcriptional regulator
MSNPTKAQIKAMEWLAEEVGAGWKLGSGKLTAALNSASLHGYVEGEWGDFGPRGGRVLRWRLSDKGLNYLSPRTAPPAPRERSEHGTEEQDDGK